RIMSLCTPISTSFPYTTLFRSVIEEAAGCSIPELFARGGEMLFRSCERQALIQFIDSAEGVIALGGGTLQQQSVIDKLKASGLRSEEHTSELQSRFDIVCRLLL